MITRELTSYDLTLLHKEELRRERNQLRDEVKRLQSLHTELRQHAESAVDCFRIGDTSGAALCLNEIVDILTKAQTA